MFQLMRAARLRTKSLLAAAGGVSLAVVLCWSLIHGSDAAAAGADTSTETAKKTRTVERGGSRDATRCVDGGKGAKVDGVKGDGVKGDGVVKASAEGEGGSKSKEVKGEVPTEVYSTGYDGSYRELIDFINAQVRKGWAENGVIPSSPADDSEWVRRVHLDLVGHIPDLDMVQAFLADKSVDKRAKLIDKLLEDPGYVRQFTTIWTNLLIGRATPQNISRPALQKFLRTSFGRNRGWDKIVVDLLTAEGHFEENGATNFLLSHLNEGGVPATAISARLFLGIQVQCTQCHNHPFNDWKQNSFWEFNSFFKQMRRIEHREYNEKTGRMDFSYFELAHQDYDGPVYFERRNGVMEVAYPKFNDVEVSPDGGTERRKELAKIIVAGEKPQLADATVNRMWGHFFGFGFTRPVDDMGPHKAPSHPELLERMSRELVKANYDLKQLIRWICNSEAYNLTSRFNDGNMKDDPAAGEMPTFSHLYMKSMSVEQLYDSLLVATNAHRSGSGGWDQAEARRQQWLQQFVQTFGTDENDESTTFDGTIPQALMMMNGELIQNALKPAQGSTLNQAMTATAKPADKAKLLYLATLSRVPTAKELAAANQVMKNAKSPLEAYQDLYWALLNSNEFILVH